MMYGYAGTLLRIDLSKGEISKEPLPQDKVDEYIGGRGLVAKFLWDELPPETEPFNERNIFIAATGPLTGILLPGSSKTHFGSKSAATGGYADSNMGGYFGPELKYAGYDVLILTGKASEPSYLFIDDANIEIRSAAQYWGKGAITTEKELKEELGKDFQIITVGPAAEKLVRFACICHDFGRQAGRTGIGAVLGSKNIKAIAVRGTGAIPVFDIEQAYKKGRDAYRAIYDKPGFTGWTPEGTAGLTDWINKVGAFPTRNFQTSYADHYKEINGKAINDRLKIIDKGCFCCPTPCGKYSHTETAQGSAFVEGPEYETIALFGGSCMLSTIEDIAYANYLCDELGLDTVSAASVAAWTIECFERGILNREQIGREVHFGDLQSIVYLLEKISKREGFFDLLAEGVKRASDKVGQDSATFAIQVKGLEWTGYECRNAPGMMLAYMTADIGAHHNRAWVLGADVTGSSTSVHDLISAGASGETMPKVEVSGKAAIVIDSQTTRPIFDILGVCRLQYMEIGFEVEHYEKIFYAVTGKKKSWEDFRRVSEKIWHLTRCFSVREIKGFGRHFDYPPARLSDEPIKSGPNKGHRITREELDLMLDEYYKARGWDKNGVPMRKTLEDMDMKEIAESIEVKSNHQE